MPSMYVALDLEGSEQALQDMPDELMFGASGPGDFLPLFGADDWLRNWRAFPGTAAGKKEADLYAKTHHTVLIVEVP